MTETHAMLDHVSLPVSDLTRAARFYDRVLAPLGLVRRKELARAIGFGTTAQPAPAFWLLASEGERAARPGRGLHVSFAAQTRSAVDRFYELALENGGVDAGAPGPRAEYTQPFYGAFVFDLDGFKVEAVCRREATRPLEGQG